MSPAATVSRAQLVEKARQFPARTFMVAGIIAAGGGAAVFLWALTTGQAARAWQSYHVNFMFWTGLAQGLVVFAATQKLAKGHWSGLVIRFAESAAAFLVVALALYVGLVLGRAYIFSWLREPRPDLGGWLTSRFFFPRNGLVLAALAWPSWRFVRHDLAPDVRELADGRPADLPEETYFIFYRLIGPWRPVGIAVFLLVFLLPFVGLLGAKPKKYPPTFLAFALVSLAGIWLERYLEIVPSINGGAGPAIGIPELGVTALFGGLFLLAMGWFATRYPMISPRLAADTLEREQH